MIALVLLVVDVMSEKIHVQSTPRPGEQEGQYLPQVRPMLVLASSQITFADLGREFVANIDKFARWASALR